MILNQSEAKRRIVRYLKEHNIPYMEGLCGDAPQITMLYKGCENCPDKVLVSTFFQTAQNAESILMQMEQNGFEEAIAAMTFSDYLTILTL